MKKIFLTSGIVVCMACPAFATGFTSTQTGIIDNACDQPTLGVYSGATNLDAIWTKNVGSITFSNNTSYTQTQCGASNATVTHDDVTASNPATLYTRYDDAVYGTQNDRNLSINPISSLTSPSRTGYTFGGYYSDSNLTTKKINANGSFVDGGNIKNLVTTNNGTGTLYAEWTPKTYTVTYACGTAGANTTVNTKQVNNENVSLTQTVTYDDCYSLDSITNRCDVPEQFGWTFAGWECKNGDTAASMPNATADTTTGYYAAGEGGVWNSDTLTNVTCTAKWAAKTITPITWTIGTGATPGEGLGSTSCTYEGSVTLPGQPSKTGYTFGGWAVNNSTRD